MAPITVNANLQLVAPGVAFNGVWVRLVSDLDGSAYVAGAVSDSLGNFSVAGAPLGPGYQIQISNPATGGSSSGPWTGAAQNFQPGQNPVGTFVVNLTIAATPTSAGFSEQTFPLNGLLTTDVVFVNAPAAPNALAAVVAARVSAVNTLALTISNASAAANTPTGGNYRVAVIRT